MLLSITVLGLCSYSQTRQISGQIKDEKGQPIPYATIKIKGARQGASADQNGNFKIEVSGAKPTLLVSAAGYDASELSVTDGNTVGVVLKAQSSMSEVVVTALGIKRNKNSLTYAAQQISGDQVSAARGNNFISSMSGKLSGVEIRQGNALGGSTNVVIRGTKSLTGNNQALFVVDGVPIDNTRPIPNPTAPNASSTTATLATGRGGFDYGNAAADINPDDIESINVLKGAAATALYGSRAANGVVMITTKKGKRGLGITVNSGFTVGSMDKSTYTKYQKEYGAGYQPTYSSASAGSPDERFEWKPNPWGPGNISVVPTYEDASYGPKFDPTANVYQWDAFVPTSPNYQKATPWVAAQNDPTYFFDNHPVSNNNSIMLDGGSDKGTFKLGYTRSEEKGLLPNSKIIKNIVNFGGSYNITNNLTASVAGSFSKVSGLGRYGTGYDNWNVNKSFRQWWQTNVDMKALKDAYFSTHQNMTWNWKNPTAAGGAGLVPIFTDNPYWTRYENYENDNRYRIFGNTSLNYKVANWLNILGRISLDSYDEQQEERIAVGSQLPASYTKSVHTFRELNYDLLANFDKDLTKNINLKGLLGTNMRRTTNTGTYATTNGGLVIPGLYALNNSLNAPAAPTEMYQPIAVDGYFAGATVGYKEFATLDGTFRRDRSSTLPANNNAYNYYSISGGFVFSKLLMGHAEWITYGKLRASYAEVGNSGDWGATSDVFTKPTPFGSAVLFALPTTKANNNLKPERTKSKELGLEMSFLKGRLGFDVSVYETKSVNQILNSTMTTAIGYSAKWVNAGTIQNRGVEVNLHGTPVKTQNFSWDVNVNWTLNRNKVVDLFQQSTNLVLGSFQQGITINATKGQAYGTIQGTTWVIDSASGQKLVDDVPLTPAGKPNVRYGRYIKTGTTTNVLGNINPDWVGGIYNTVRYKNISLGFLIDMRKGGDLFSLDLAYGFDSGMYPETVGKNANGKDTRAPLADGGGVLNPGVTMNGKVANTIMAPNINGTYGYQFNPNAAFVYDASYVKLRELNITYSFPASLVKKMDFIKAIDLSVIGRNLWIIHKNLPYADPEENIASGNIQGYQTGAYPTARTLGVNLKLKF